MVDRLEMPVGLRVTSSPHQPHRVALPVLLDAEHARERRPSAGGECCTGILL
jgi:hypothetical protein